MAAARRCPDPAFGSCSVSNAMEPPKCPVLLFFRRHRAMFARSLKQTSPSASHVPRSFTTTVPAHTLGRRSCWFPSLDFCSPRRAGSVCTCQSVPRGETERGRGSTVCCCEDLGCAGPPPAGGEVSAWGGHEERRERKQAPSSLPGGVFQTALLVDCVSPEEKSAFRPPSFARPPG